QYPTTGVGTGAFSVTVDGNSQIFHLRGGDGGGGPYQWSQMPLSPDSPTLTQAQAIGALTFDAGVAVNMDYESDGSAAFMYLAQQALTNTFKYAHAGYFEDDVHGLSGANLRTMINPNLDAHL